MSLEESDLNPSEEHAISAVGEFVDLSGVDIELQQEIKDNDVNHEVHEQSIEQPIMPAVIPESMPSDVDMDAVCSYLNVEKSSIGTLNSNVLQKIQSTIEELTEIKSEKLTLEVKMENISLVNNKKETLLKKKIANLEEAKAELTKSKNSLEEDKSQLQQRANELEVIYSTSNVASSTSESKLNEATTENRKLMEIISKKNNEIESLKSEYSDLQESNSKLRKSVIELESSTQVSDSNLVHANMKVQSLETRLELMDKNHEWLSSELEKISGEFSEYRKSKSAEISALQLELDQKSSDLNTIRLTSERLSVRYEETSTKLDSSLVQIKTLKDQKSAEEEEYLKEISIKERLVTLLQKSVEDAKSKIQHLESRLDVSREGVESESATLQSTVDKYKAQLERSEEKIKQLEQTIDEFSQTPVIDPNATVSGFLPLSPSAKATAAKHSGLSLSQLYADFMLIKRQLTQERRAKERMQQQMDAFVNELEQKAPILNATKERSVMLEKELTELSVILETTSKEKELLQRSQNEMTSKLEESQVEISGLRKQRADLARQVQQLLVQVTVRSDNGGPLTPAEKKAIERIAKGDVVLNDSDTDRLISDRLVTFQNIIDLQKKNEDLLRIVRELGAKAEQREQLAESKLENLESAVISEAKDAILTLQDELKSVDTKLNAVTRERDMFRSLLSDKGQNNILSGDLSGSGPDNDRISALSQKYDESKREIAAVNEQLEKLRVESDTTISILNKQINSLTTERSELALTLAREKSSSELTTERYNTIQENLKYARSEIEELRKNGQILYANLAKQEAKAHEAVEQLSEAKSTAESLRSESINLKHEKQLWKSIEERLNKENATLIEEKNKLNTLLMNLQFVDRERESRNSEAQKRWTDHTETLEKELSDVKTRLADTSTELKDVQSRKEADINAYQERIDSLTSELGNAKEELISKKSLADNLELRVQTLATKLASSESRIQDYQSIAQSENSDSGLVSEALKLKAELDDARAELEEANKNVSHFRAIAAAAEEALESLTQSSDSYKMTTSKTIEELESSKKALTEETEILKEQLESLNNELDGQRAASKKDLDEAHKETESLRAQAEESTKLKADYDAKVALIESSFQQQVSVATEAQQNYEKELQKHAEASKAYSSLREEANNVKEKIQELSLDAKQARDTLVKSQESWDTQKSQLEDELRVATARVNDLSSQNHILYNQIDALTKKSSESTASDLEGASDELRELVTLLRREKDISDTRLEVANRDLTTTRQKLSLVTSELDKTRSELLKSQSRDSDVDRITKEYENLQKDLEQLSLLRESNVTLRNELKMTAAKVKVIENQLTQSQSKVQPLETELTQLKTELRHKEQELKLSLEEKDRWKQRSNDILKKFDRIDPDEHKQLQEKVAELTKKLEESANAYQRLRDEAQEKLKKSSANYKALLARLEEANKEKDVISKTAEEAKTKSEALQTEVDTLKSKVTELENHSKKASSQKKAAKDNSKENAAVLETLKTELESTRAQLKEKVEQLAKAKEFEAKVTELQTLKATLEQKITDLEAQITKLTSELENAKTVSSTGETPATENQSQLIAELQSKLDKVSSELQAAKTTIENQSSDADAPVATVDESAITAALEEQKKTLRSEFDAELEKSLADAREVFKNSIRAPSMEKLERLAKLRTATLEEEHATKISELKAEYEKKLADASQGTNGTSNDAAEYESKLAAMKKSFEEAKEKEIAEVTTTSYEQARQATLKEAAMRTKLLQSKIDKLTKQVQDLKKSSGETTVAATPAPAPLVTTLPQKPTVAEPAATEAPADHGLKRPAEEDDGPQEKKAKADE